MNVEREVLCFMEVVSLIGGLGSQMFKYAFYLALKEKCPGECLIDTSFFLQRKSWNGYELNRLFGIEAPDLKNRLTREQINSITEKKSSYIDECLKYLSKKGKVSYYFMGTRYTYSSFPLPIYRKLRQKVLFFLHMCGKHYQYTLEQVITDDNAYFDEYFHNSDQHFRFCKDIVKKAFLFPEFDDEKNKLVSQKMKNEDSIAIHIRRTDHLADNGKLFNNEYYKKSVNYIKKVNSDKLVFYIFSDDLNWCRLHLSDIGINKGDEVEFVGWNKEESSYKDMQLMTYCKHNILAISSFSWWGYYLSERDNKIVCAPVGYWTEVENHF